jgi:protein-S-isoprenylcysteine O-methyltransferase Ste14
MEKILTFTKKNRILFSRVLIGCLVVLLLISEPMWHPRAVIDIALEFLSLVLVLIAAFGRLWSLSYISGHKTKDLITEGPYSMVRNPLYFFSLIGACGIGISSESIIVLGSILLAFAIYYPLVIRAEEERLLSVHKEIFQSYSSEIPSFIPKFSRFHEPTEYPVKARLFRRAFFSVMWFPLAYILILTIAHLQEAGLLPVLFSIP